MDGVGVTDGEIDGVRVELDEGVAVVTIDRPDRLNALDPPAYAALARAWERVRDDPEIRCAVVTGAGERAFCVGADLRSAQASATPWSDLGRTQTDLHLGRGLEVWKPVVAAVNGHCLGGGMTLLLATDVRLAAEHATFGVPEVTRGFLPGNGGTQRLLAELGRARGMELLLTGQRIDAARALDWGLVSRVVPRADLLTEAMTLARTIAANAPLAVQAAKELALRSQSLDQAQGIRMEQLYLAALRHTDDVREGVAAFTERREPRFQGR